MGGQGSFAITFRRRLMHVSENKSQLTLHRDFENDLRSDHNFITLIVYG